MKRRIWEFFEKKGKRHHRSEFVGFDAVGCGWVCLVCGAFVKGLVLKAFKVV